VEISKKRGRKTRLKIKMERKQQGEKKVEEQNV